MRPIVSAMPLTALLAGASLVAAACTTSEEHRYGSSPEGKEEARRGRVAVADIEARSGSELRGRARFTEMQGGVLVEVWIEDAPPGAHATHIHETGDCSAPDATSAGDHWNPTGEPHGGPFMERHHKGDLGNMWVERDGSGYHAVFMPGISVRGEHSVVGRAIVVHADRDDLTSQPAGAAGARIGCGVIRES